MNIFSNSSQLCSHYGFSFLEKDAPLNNESWHLIVDEDTQRHFLLGEIDNSEFRFQIDFAAPDLRYRVQYGGGRKEPLAKAIGLKKNWSPTLIDATTGLGRESFLLWQMGCNIISVERNSVIYVLLDYALKRLCSIQAVSNWKLINKDSIDYLENILNCSNQARPDVVYLDPMFPPRQKSAAVKLEMRIFKALVGDDGDANKLLESAKKVATNRVVVKRPKSAPPVGDLKPSYNIGAGKYRFDIYLPLNLA